jgi:transcriptional regulator with XRE-family HTH domain
MVKVKNEKELFDKVWGYLLKLLQSQTSTSNASQVAKQLGVEVSTVTRWMRGDRGEKVTLAAALNIIFKLGGTVAELARELGDENMASILQMALDEPELIQSFIYIMTSDSVEAKKLKDEISYLRNRLQSNSKQ